MSLLVTKPSDGTLPYNSETVTDPTIEKSITFESFGTLYRCNMKIPLYMWNKLKAEDWDRAEKMVQDRISEIRLSAAAEGKLLSHQWGENVESFAKRCVYNEFMKRQVEAGNDEGHAVPTDFL